jgi:hypothetical protein
MPSDFKQMTDLAKDSIIVEELTGGGMALRGHLDTYNYGKKTINFVQQHYYKSLGYDMDRMKKTFDYEFDIDTITKSTLQIIVEKSKFDYIVIQDHGSHIVNEKFNKYVAAKSLDRLKQILLNSISKDAKIIYFTEYPNKELYKEVIPNSTRRLRILSYDTITCNIVEPMDSAYLIRNGGFLTDSSLIINSPIEDIESYEKGLAQLQGVYPFEISPTARIFHLLKIENKNWRMYRMGGHPSKKASFMFACVYYEMITGKSCLDIDFKGKLSKKNATIIKTTVHNYIMNN